MPVVVPDALVDMQNKITELEMAYHAKVDKLSIERDVAKNVIFKERTDALKAHNATKAFWTLVIRSHPDIQQELMGAYDDDILNSLSNFNVTFAADGGYKIEFEFGSNDYFNDSRLWVEVVPAEELGDDVSLKCSGVNWKPGRGPADDDDDEQPARQTGAKVSRDATGDLRGPTLFELFEAMPPHPLDDMDEEDDEEDEEETEEATKLWQDMYDERMEIIHCLVEEIWEDPMGVFAGQN
jgi:hypothetical protein